MIKLIACAALFLAPAAAQAQKDCLDGQLLSGVLLGVAPDLLKAAGDRCRPMLPKDAFLLTRARTMGERIRTELGDPSITITALVRNMTGVDASEALDAKTITTLFSTPIRKDIEKMDAKDCGALDQLMSGLEPLPASRLKQVVIGFLTLGGKGDGSLNLCPAA